ncbi:uncharacterized protein LOC129289274 [Prosopis cineraria]|uniref:uncharacterized protein LOC129289274 n=1 Tax=Prosopis cineraria TaxID=364024 RepID=UPI00240EFA3F|nr:uncharacterized protein LOC129289274 [Prosopis cineraria]
MIIEVFQFTAKYNMNLENEHNDGSKGKGSGEETLSDIDISDFEHIDDGYFNQLVDIGVGLRDILDEVADVASKDDEDVIRINERYWVIGELEKGKSVPIRTHRPFLLHLHLLPSSLPVGLTFLGPSPRFAHRLKMIWPLSLKERLRLHFKKVMEGPLRWPPVLGLGRQWIIDIEGTLEFVNEFNVKTRTIWMVPEKLRATGLSYRPQLVAMGPIHRGTGSELQIMEDTKWRHVYRLLSRAAASEHKRDWRVALKDCSGRLKSLDGIIRASYADGEKIKLEAKELAGIMLRDGCFLLELLHRLHENVIRDPPPRADQIEPSLDFTDDKKKILRVLTDLTLLENQIPFLVLDVLHKKTGQGLQPLGLAESLFGCKVSRGDFHEGGVHHFLHLMHSCSPDPYDKNKNVTSVKAKQELKRCAKELQAMGLEIDSSSPTIRSSPLDNKTGIVASALREFVEMFDFNIHMQEDEQLKIPTLCIKEGTEEKWGNFIAWEQLGLTGISYKFTSYAYFLKGLICSVQDIVLLKSKSIIVVDEDFGISDQKLLALLQNITAGAENMDNRYSDLCVQLNAVKQRSVPMTGWWTMKRHRFQSFLELLGSRIRNTIKILGSQIRNTIKILFNKYIPDTWMLLKVGAAASLLVLTAIQTIYTVKTYHAPTGH